MRPVMLPDIMLPCIRPMPVAHSTAATPMTANTIATTFRAYWVLSYSRVSPFLAICFQVWPWFLLKNTLRLKVAITISLVDAGFCAI